MDVCDLRGGVAAYADGNGIPALQLLCAGDGSRSASVTVENGVTRPSAHQRAGCNALFWRYSRYLQVSGAVPHL
ncbi:hypothetical protein [Paenibacillus mendelii]|uniref:Uncharacterized protein n=1 Tax=Paenibacillus mendelii TaxID=206163 RepID=A0ABV6J2W5_9BACL|nr:hypothetical protein [Paenibacillus mendelii]MCQ6559316.1 hypothetical protein [Paenibacillus mendelii]